MPNFPPGSPNNTSVPANPTWVFTPTPNAPASVSFYNPGSSVVYVGVNPTPSTGIPILPGNRPVRLQNVNVSLSACSSFTKGAVAGTMTASAITAGTTTLTTAAAPSSLPAGTTFVVGNGTGAEALVVASTSASSVVTFTAPCLFDHVASSVLNLATFTSAPITVQAGVL